MTDLKRSVQKGAGVQHGRAHRGTDEAEGEANRGSGFGTAEPGTRGTDRDADASGESKNEGPGHGPTKR